MTSAPANLVAVRRLLLTHLDIHENSGAYPTDLDPGEVGIVGDSDHRGGYHCGRDRVDLDDYSVAESPRDKAGLSDYACGLDVGLFRVTTPAGTYDLPHFSKWLVAQCVARAPDTQDIREIIYSPDGRTVRRWDRLGRRSSGDDSHRGHTHTSFFRDAIKAGRDQTPLFHRYLTAIGLEDNMDLTTQNLIDIAAAVAKGDTTPGNPTTNYTMGGALSDTAGRVQDLIRRDIANQTTLAAIQANVLALAGKDWTDEEAIVTGVLNGLGGRNEDEVAQILVAAGQDPKRLGGALLALAPQEPQA